VTEKRDFRKKKKKKRGVKRENLLATRSLRLDVIKARLFGNIRTEEKKMKLWIV